MKRVLHRIDPKDERGVSILIVALVLVVIFGMMVLVVDLGALIVKHRGLVNANDAAATAAAGSFARNDGDAAASAADRLARANVDDAEHDADWWNVILGLEASGCDPSTCGTVTVKYQAGQSLFFAPVLGLGDEVTAHGAATAMWGPAGGGQPAPIPVLFDWLQQCAIPGDDAVPDCGLWLSERDAAGNPLWSWINLRPCPGSGCGWNTGDPGYSCPSNVQGPELRDWIAGRRVPLVPVNPAPASTFVCTTSGDAADYIGDLQDQIDEFKVFPVSEEQGPIGDKYDIAGFTVLRIDDVIRGDRDGDPGGTFPCRWEDVDLEQGTPVDLTDQPCEWRGLHYPGDPTKPYPRIRKGNKVFTGDVTGQCADLDYCYDVDNYEITWQSERVNNALIDWEYVVQPTPGKCGFHEPDETAVCLVVSWQGYRTGGINPGGGVDFGLRAVRLSA